MKNLGKFLYDRRIELNLAQNYLASLLNVSNQTIYKYEHGLSSPDFTILGKYASILKVSLDDMINANGSIDENYKETELSFDPDKFSNNLKVLRVKNNYTLSKLQELTGVKYQTISKWEKSESFPSIKQFISLSKIYNKSLNDIYYAVENVSSTTNDNTNQDNKQNNHPKRWRIFVPWIVASLLLFVLLLNIILTSNVIQKYEKRIDDTEYQLNNALNNNNQNNNSNNIDDNNSSNLNQGNANNNTVDSSGSNDNESNNNGDDKVIDSNDIDIVDSNGTDNIIDSSGTDNNIIDSNGTELIDSNPVEVIDDDKSPITLTINHYIENLYDDEYTLASTETKETFTGTMISVKTKNYEGFVSPENEIIIANENNSIIDYYYKRVTHKLFFDTKGGDEISPLVIKNGASIHISEIPTKTGSTFDRWYYDNRFKDPIIDNIINNITTDITIYAYFTGDIKYGSFIYDVVDDCIIIKGLKDGNVFDIPTIIDEKIVKEIDIESCDVFPYRVFIPTTIEKITHFNVSEDENHLDIYYDNDISSWMNIDILCEVFKNSTGSFFYKSGDNYIELRDELVIPSGITKISDNAFAYLKNVTSISIEDGVEIIGENAFSNMPSLERVGIPSSIVDIKIDAFNECTSLNRIDISDLEAWMNIDFHLIYDEEGIGDYKISNPLFYAHNLYINDELMTSITIPSSMTKIIKPFTLFGCSITNIIVPETVQEIEKNAFNGCYNLKSITLPFVGNKRISATDTYQYPFGYIFGNTFINSSQTPQSYICPEYYLDENFYEVFSIPWELEEVVITSSTIIPDCAFVNMNSLKRIVLPDGIKKIGSRAFERCTEVISINIPDGVTKIGDHAFHECARLKEIIIPDSVTEIGMGAFETCEELKRVVLSNNINIINRATFGTCTSLEEINMPEKLTIIDGSAFSSCLKLKNLTLPSTIFYIGEMAFYNCKSLESINIPSGIEIIESYTFQYCSRLETVILPNTITRIGSYSFDRCASLKNINFPSSLEYIDGYAFSHCISLTNVDLSSSVRYIGNNSFEYCTSLKMILFSYKLDGIGPRALSYCSSLEIIEYENITSFWKNNVFKDTFWDLETGNYIIVTTNGSILKE
ncbi:leucine-rich repeat protein [bacterium]|nr:leucine-rich repeat protein [bacterium]